MGHREFTTSNCHPGAGISSIQRSPSVESSELVALQSDGVSCTKSKFPFHGFLYLTRLLFPPQHEPELSKSLLILCNWKRITQALEAGRRCSCSFQASKTWL